MYLLNLRTPVVVLMDGRSIPTKTGPANGSVHAMGVPYGPYQVKVLSYYDAKCANPIPG